MPKVIPPPNEARLAAALNFTAIDLNANRTGDISLAQADRLRRTWRRLLITSLIALGVIVLTAALFLYAGQRTPSAILLLIGIALTVGNALLMGRLVQAYFRLRGDLCPPIVVQEGTITRTLRVAGRGRAYLIAIDGQPLYVTKPVFNAFADSTRYRLYRAPASKIILSAERIEAGGRLASTHADPDSG